MSGLCLKPRLPVVFARRVCRKRTPSLHSNDKLPKCNNGKHDCHLHCRRKATAGEKDETIRRGRGSGFACGESPTPSRKEQTVDAATGDLTLPDSWSSVLADELSADYFSHLQTFLKTERDQHIVFPPADEVFTAFALTPYQRVRVLLLGQDPYHDTGQAHGLCFSVRPGVKPPPSLRNIYRELHDDLGCEIPNHGYLASWANQGVLMLNTVLTVRAHRAHSHRKRGWEQFTDAVIRRVNERKSRVVFVLWGKPAQEKIRLINTGQHAVIQAPHPSPLSARRGFLGSRPFSAINRVLRDAGQSEIDWCIPPLDDQRFVTT
jgi:uracil-DNA glycosylase